MHRNVLHYNIMQKPIGAYEFELNILYSEWQLYAVWFNRNNNMDNCLRLPASNIHIYLSKRVLSVKITYIASAILDMLLVVFIYAEVKIQTSSKHESSWLV